MLQRLTPVLISILAMATPAFSDSIVLTSVKDNTLFESASGELSSGQGTGMFAGRTNQGVDSIRRALVAFDVSAIPAGSTITSAVLTLFCSQSSSAAQTIGLHVVTESWGEGASNSGNFGTGAPSAAGDATWIHRFYPGTAWTTVGGSFAAAPSATQSVGIETAYSWGSTAGMVADVQAWLDNPAANNGWLILGNETVPGTAKRFDTRENTRNRPSLRVEYTPEVIPVETTTWGRVKALLGS